MPQIPVFTPNQRIDAGTPVAAIDTRSARMGGEAVAQFGNALSDLGYVLETQAQKAGVEIDKGLLRKARNETEIFMMGKAQEFAQQGIDPSEAPTGIDGVNRYRQELKQAFDERAASLPERLREQYYAEISNEEVKYSSIVLAGEVEKREKTVMALRQDNINKKGDIVRQDPGQIDVTLSQLDEEISNDGMLNEGMKAKAKHDAFQNTIKSAVQGMAARGQWEQAESMLTKKYAGFYSADELAREQRELLSQKNQYFDQRWQDESRANTRRNQKSQEDQDNAVQLYLATLTNAGNNQMAIDPVMMNIDLDPRLSTAMKNRMKNQHMVDTVKSDQYEAQAFDRFAENPQAAISSLREASGTDSITMDRGFKLMSQMKALDSAQKDPTIRSAIQENRKLIESFKEPRSYDPETRTYKEGDDSLNQRARATFMAKAAELAQKGPLTSADLESLAVSTLKTQYSSQVTPVPVEGLTSDQLANSQAIQKTLLDLAQRRNSGEFNTPEKKAALGRQVQGLLTNKVRAQFREELAKHANKETGR